MPLTRDEVHELTAAARRGERHAQHRLYVAFAPLVFGVCVRYARTRSEADDWAQDAWVRAFTKLAQYDGSGELGAWLRRVAVTTCLQHLRRGTLAVDGAAAARLAEGEGALPADLHVAAVALDRMSADELVAHIEALPEGYRLVFNLVAVEGYSHAEAAEALGITVSTSRSQLTRARATLQRRLAGLFQVSL